MHAREAAWARRGVSARLVQAWVALGPRWFPFADIATPDLPLTRLLRLSLFQVSVGMALVLLVGTLNRVMIVELDVPATVVGAMLALPLLFAPFRVLVGFRSDTHRCALGWRRVPFIWKGTMWQFGGFAIMPFALLVLAGTGEAATLPAWVGISAAALAFLLVGAGAHTVQTVGLALATDLTPPESHARVCGFMYVMLLLGMMASALVFGLALENFSPGRLIQVIQGVAVATIMLNMVAIWKQEARRPARSDTGPVPEPDFAAAWAQFCSGGDAVRRLLVVGLGTAAFGMADVLLEPFGGQVLDLSVAATTQLSALLALGGLAGFVLASRAVSAGADPYRMACYGALLGVPAFLCVIGSAPAAMATPFVLGNFLVGLGAALFAHGTLTATMRRAPVRQAGLAIGAWGAVQATALGLAMAFGTSLRDAVDAAVGGASSVLGFVGVATGYVAVYAVEIALLIATIVVIVPLLKRRGSSRYATHASVEA